MAKAEDTIMEEREKLMVSPKGGGDPTLRIAHFLKPSVTSIDGVFDLPSPFLSSIPTNSASKKPPLKVEFNGWRCPPKNWKTWVSSMRSLYQSVWKKAGIHEAIINSTYTITRNDNLVFGVTERWCSESNTFIFPWGETTITLEDILILGGYSVRGDSVLTPLEAREMEETEEKLLRARLELVRGKAHKPTQYEWLAKFMAGRSGIEHEAFLAFWLSRFVFPATSFNTIGTNVFPIAVHLSRGIKIALAPAVLSSLYRDLSLLKQTIVASNKLETSRGEDVALALAVRGPLQFVQIWAWERFLALRPAPCSIVHGGPRLGRWDKAKKVNIEDMRLVIDSAAGNFLWRPYATFSRDFYNEEGGELESLALCLRDSELVGLGCIEQYLPHRVSRQFGLDQDLPGPVARSNATPEIAWSNYKRPIRDEKLYIPPPDCEPGVTTRYVEWWSKSNFGPQHQQEAVKHVIKKKMISNSNGLERTTQTGKRTTDPAVPPGFPPKCISIESSDSSDDDMLPISEMLRRNVKRRGGQTSMGSQLQSQPYSTANSGTIQMMESVVKPTAKVETELVTEGSSAVAENASESRADTMAADAIESRVNTPVNNVVSINNSNLGESHTHHTYGMLGFEIEARISKLEKVVALLKAAKVGQRFA